MHNKGSPSQPWVASDKNELILISEALRGSEWNIERLHLSSKHYRSSFICKLAILNWQRLAQTVQQIRVTMEDKTSTLHKATISLCFSLIYIITNNKKNSDFQINKHSLLIYWSTSRSKWRLQERLWMSNVPLFFYQILSSGVFKFAS